jgi:MFS family permease
MKELFEHRAFVRFWFARVASVAGQQMLLLAIGWHMYELTGSALDLGLVGLLQFLPALATTLVAGHAADRMHRARLVAICLTVQMSAAAFLAATTHAHLVSRELLFGLSIVIGGVRPFQMSAQQALVPRLVPAPLLSRATAFSSSAQQVAVIGGPAIGGLLFAVGVNTVYLTCAVLFGLGAVLCMLVNYTYVAPAREPVSADVLLAGARFVWSRPLLLGVVSLDLFAVLLGGATALLPVFVKEVLHVGPESLGLLRSAPAVGALVVGLWLARRPIVRGVGRKMLISVGIYGLAIVAFGASSSLVFSLLALVLAGGADMVSVIIRQTLIQMETPDAMRGRVAAINTLFIGASNQLGEFESGVTAALIGPVGSVILGGLGTIAVSLAWARLFKPLAKRETFE